MSPDAAPVAQPAGPFLRTLAPALRNLEKALAAWLDGPHPQPLKPLVRVKLEQLLPVADIVLYVGSQEKYHDQIGWDLFRKQRRRRAFAFVLNKWDRCLHAQAGSVGVRPDEDLLRDLHAEGFEQPLLFRTAAQYWLDRATQNGQAPPPPAGEQFQDLSHWLELALA